MIGTVINNSWQIVRLIGEGGMGAVYEARHIHLGIARAVKVLLPQWAGNAQLLQRFFNEARATAALNHKNIIAIHDYGALPDGTQFIMMDFLEGNTLGALLRRTNGSLPLDRALRIITQIALALTAAHQRGIAHRDLKPENVFLTTRDGEADHVVLLDFGIAKLLELKQSVTQTNAVIGTPSYMPPEQLRGTKDVDHRVDIFALGAIAYLTVTGFMPFQKPGETLGDYFEASTVELHERQVGNGPIDPRTRNRALPDDWAIGIMSALHKEASRRMRLDELIVLFKRSTPNGHKIVDDCAKDLLKQAALGETMRAVDPPQANERVTVQLKPSSSAPNFAVAAPSAPPPYAGPQVGVAPHAAATYAAPHAWPSQPPPSGPATPMMSAPRAEAAPMLAPSEPMSRSTLSGAASEVMPVSRPSRRWPLAVAAVAVVAGAVVGVLVVKDRGTRSEITSSTATEPPADAAQLVVSADAGVSIDAAALVAVAVTAPIDAPTPTAEGSAKPSNAADIREPAPVGAGSSKAKQAVKPQRETGPREMGEIRVIVETTYAEVYVDGKHVGSTPWAGKLTTGVHTVTLRNDNIKRRETFKVTISASSPLTIEKPW